MSNKSRIKGDKIEQFFNENDASLSLEDVARKIYKLVVPEFKYTSVELLKYMNIALEKSGHKNKVTQIKKKSDTRFTFVIVPSKEQGDLFNSIERTQESSILLYTLSQVAMVAPTMDEAIELMVSYMKIGKGVSLKAPDVKVFLD